MMNDTSQGREFEPPRFLRGIEKSQIRQVFDRAKPGSINLGLGEPDLPTPDVIRKAATRVISEEQNGYTSHAGLLELRQLVAGDYPAMNLEADQVVITAGSQEALYLALMTLVDEGDEVLLPNPGFVAYPTIVKMAGGIAKYYRLPATADFAFDIDEFRRAITARTKVVVVISPSNPTGRALSESDINAMAKALEGSNAFVVSDEIYRDLYYTNDRPASISSVCDRTIVLSGLSKSMSMTGWRLGWICGDPSVVKNALVLHGYVTTCASTVSQKAALASWTAEAEESRAQRRAIFRQRRDYFMETLSRELKLRAVTPDGAFYTMVDVKEYGSSWDVCEALLEAGVITVPGSGFGSEAEGFLRVSLCADLPVMAEAVKRMSVALKS